MTKTKLIYISAPITGMEDTYTKYKCAVQRDIEEASIGDGCGNERVYNATHSADCPYKQTERKTYNKKKKTLKGQITLEL